MTDRQQVTQRPPRIGLDLTAFPEAPLPAGEQKFRAHEAFRGSAGAWHFSNGPGGRFNLSGTRGTCYLADSVEAAVYEAVGPDLDEMDCFGRADAAKLMVTPVIIDDDVTTADLDTKRARHYGVKNELSTMVPYAIPQKWAAAFDAAGFGGLRYISRQVSGSDDASWAIFGPAGPDPTRSFDAAGARDGITAFIEAGVTLLGTATTADLTVIAPPAWPTP
ncbi:RES family NAD+ phosphorylase [Diaminobutyricibacter sp. McL0618]|uniref:RES family NAD+ phosphorylase n=1 Tax=Leifsonia sp. McL0618 TaxID=3415677 RepID=UPI003CEFA574